MWCAGLNHTHNNVWCVFSLASDRPIWAQTYPYMDENVIRNTAKCFTGSTEVFLIIISLCSLWRSLLDLVKCVLAVFWFFFFFWEGEYVFSSQMSMKSHRDIMKLSKRPLDVVFFQSVWPRCKEIGHFIWWNFCTWNTVALNGFKNRDFQLWSHLICHFTGIYYQFSLCFDCVFPQTFGWTIFWISISLPGVELCTLKTAPCSRTDVLARSPLSLIWKKALRGRSGFSEPLPAGC